jgi:hypothetical protein
MEHHRAAVLQHLDRNLRSRVMEAPPGDLRGQSVRLVGDDERRSDVRLDEDAPGILP